MSKPKVKKIAVQKHDEASFVIEQLLDNEGEHIVFSIPKGAKFSDTVSNYRLLKRQAELLGADVSIESVDDDALALAEESGIEAKNPFFRRMKKAPVSDILVKKKVVKKERGGKGKKEEILKEPLVLHKHRDSDEDEEVFMHKLEGKMQEDKGFQKYHAENEEEFEQDRKRASRYIHKSKSFFRKRNFLLALIIILIFGVFPYLAFGVLPRADITLETAKEEWNFSGKVLADTSLGAIAFEKDVIPGQVFSEKLTQSFTFPAHGEEDIERKAGGKIRIYNAHNSEEQALVASTRFETPEGKIFRIVEGVTVPGAKIEAGKIVPAFVDADIVADRAGEAYNLGPVKRLSVPGFAGTDKANGFYGEIREATEGGFVGKSKVATADDLEAALKQSRESIEESVDLSVGAQIPDEFLVLDEASEFVITDEIVRDRADANGDFRITLEAELRQFAFQEEDLETLLESKVLEDFEEGHKVDSAEIEYLSVRADFPEGKLNLTLNYEALVEKDINLSLLKRSLAGQKEDELIATLRSVEGLSGSADVELWPFWVGKIPKNLEKIDLRVD